MSISKLGLGGAAVAVVLLSPIAAWAQDCKGEVKASSEPSVSRSLVAFPSSLFAWKAEAKKQYGDNYDTWLRAQDRRIDCKQGTDKKWVCTRTAKPCAGASGGKLPAFANLDTLELTSPRTTGDQVKLLQQYLNLHGAKLEVDGVFGTGVAAAVKKYQQEEGITADGKAGPETKKRLMESK